MSVNIDLDTTIRVPLEVVAAIKAASDGDVSSIAGMEQVATAVNAAVVDAVKALPYEIRASQYPIEAPDTVKVASKNGDEAVIQLAFRDVQKNLCHLHRSPSVSMAEIHSKLEEAGHKSPCTFKLRCGGKEYYPFRPGYPHQDADRITLLDIGFTGGEHIQVVPLP